MDCQSTLAHRRRQSRSQGPDPDDESSVPMELPAEPILPEDRSLAEQVSSGYADPDQPQTSPETRVDDMDVQDGLVNGQRQPPSRADILLLETKTHTLEDGKALTAHSMGLSAEQDTNLLASFRSLIINETNRVDGDIIQVDGGNAATGAPPIHFTILRDWFMPYDDRIKDESSQIIETKVASHGPSLVCLYFKHVHPVYCAISKVRFLRAYKKDKLNIPASLRGVIYGLGAGYWKQDPRLRTIPCPFEQYELFQVAQASLERELEGPDLWKLQACLLMLHEKAAINGTFETPRIWTLSAQAVACAQMIGLHRDPSNWNIDPWEKSLRKKLWWATYVTDIWSSVSHGNPPHIYRASYTTSTLDLDDLKFDEDVPRDLRDMVDVTSANFDLSTGVRFLELVRLTQILHNLLDTAL